MGDRARLVSGDFTLMKSDGAANLIRSVSGAFRLTGNGDPEYCWQGNNSTKHATQRLEYDPSRVVPTGATNTPRSWGSLTCAYFGQAATS